MTKQDLQIEYKKEHGEYPPNDEAYVEWLVKKTIKLDFDKKILQLKLLNADIL